MSAISGYEVVGSLAIALTITGCGDSSGWQAGESALGSSEAPTVDAGPDQVIELPEIAELSGSIMNGARVSRFSWRVADGPSGVYFSTPSEAQTHAVFTEAGEYVLKLVAGDGDVLGSDIVRVTVGELTGHVIELDTTTTFQTLTGWEATTIAGQANPVFDEFKDELFDRAVADGINRVRLEVRAGAENDTDFFTLYSTGQIPYSVWRQNRYATVNDNDHPLDTDPSGFIFSDLDHTVETVVKPLQRRLDDIGKKLYVNLCYVAITGQIGTGLEYNHDDPDEYAEFATMTMTHLKERWEAVPDSWEMVLEPDNQAEWNGNVIGRALAATGPRMEDAGFEPRFVAPSCQNMTNAVNYFDAMAAVPGAMDYHSEFSYHRYGGVSLASLEAIQQRAETFGVDTSHLEYITAGHDVLHEDLKVGHNSAWSQYAMVANATNGDNGAGYYVVDDSNQNAPQLNVGWRTNFLRQYFQFLPAGAVRFAATSSAAQHDPIAFVRPDRGHVVIVKSASGGEYHVKDLPEGRYGIKYTTHQESAIELDDVSLLAGQILTASIPQEGVVTIYALDR